MRINMNYLIHYGVDGQKWGTRRYQNEDGSYKPGAEGRYDPVYIPKGRKLSKTEFDEKYRETGTRNFNRTNRSKLSDQEIRVKKGETFKRVSSIDEKEIREQTYASVREDDINTYSHYLPTTHGHKESYLLSYKATNDIVSPSERKRVDLFIQSLSDEIKEESKTLFGKKKESVKTGREYIESLIETAKMYDKLTGGKITTDNNLKDLGDKKARQSMSDEEYGERAYNVFTTLGLCDSNNAFTKQYLSNVTKAGYNALIDDNDAGRLSNMPFILLNSSQNLVKTGSEKLTKEMIEQAGNELTEILKRK